MSLSKEARIGLLVSVSLVILFFGFYFLKGTSLFSNDKEYYCFYTDIQGLQNSGAVQIRGLNVGHVSGTKLMDGKGVRVTISLNKSIDIPAGTTASLASLDLLGNKMIRLDLGAGPGMITPGAELPTRQEAGIIDNISDQMTPLIHSLRQTVSALDTAIAGVNVIAGPENREVISAAIKSVKATADNLASISGSISKENGEINSIVHNTNTFTTALAKNSDSIQRIVANLNNISSQMANAPIQKTFSELETTTAQLRDVMSKINNGQGSLGLLVNDKALYNSLNSSVSSLDKLMTDLKAHPKRYINVTVFGKKNKETKE